MDVHTGCRCLTCAWERTISDTRTTATKLTKAAITVSVDV